MTYKTYTSALRCATVLSRCMFTWGHKGLNWPGDHEGMTKTSLNTLQVKLMWVGERRAKSNRSEL